MNIEAKKLSLIEWITALNDERTLSQIDFFRKKTFSPEFNPTKKMTYEELVSELKQSEDDFENGRIITIEELKKEIKKW
ncbi:MAG: hypothetical protein ABI723_19910 [Bacteroidia bacterium]